MRKNKIILLVVVLFIWILLIFTSPVNADYIVEDNNSIIENGKIKDTNIEVSTIAPMGNVSKLSISDALDYINLKLHFDYTVHIIDGNINYDIMGLALKDKNTIILLDWLSIPLDSYYQQIVTHELGHLVYNNLSETEKLEYQILRGIPPNWDNTFNTSYLNQPTEIFAEDFRILFGNEESSKWVHFNENFNNHTRRLKRELKILIERGE